MAEDYKAYAKRLQEMIVAQESLPRRKAKVKGRILEPGDKGFQENKSYPWSLEGFAAGIPQKNFSIKLYGFIVMDRRTSPHVMIFKNHKALMVQGFKPVSNEPPQPFESYREAEMYVEKMHLSEDGKDFVEICAFAQKPPPGHPAPDTLFLTKEEKKNSSFDPL